MTRAPRWTHLNHPIRKDLALDETGALPRFDSTYYHAEQAYGQTLSFAVTQWGGVPDLPPPAADMIERPCP